jgi:hypothetical protein
MIYSAAETLKKNHKQQSRLASLHFIRRLPRRSLAFFSSYDWERETVETVQLFRLVNTGLKHGVNEITNPTVCMVCRSTSLNTFVHQPE